MSESNIAVKGDECSCGRRATVLHCPACGSGRIYARQNRAHTMLDGSTKLVEIQYRCMKCGHLFIDIERQFCEAPPPTKKLAEQRALILAQELSRSNPQRAQEILSTGGDVAVALKEEKDYTEEEKFAMSQDSTKIPLEEFKKANLTEVDIDFLFRKEWVRIKLLKGKPPTATVDEYVERRKKGEVFSS